MILAVSIFILVAGTIGFIFGWGARDALARADMRSYDRQMLDALRRLGGG